MTQPHVIFDLVDCMCNINTSNVKLTIEDVENILNYHGNIGDSDTRLKPKNLAHYQLAFIHKSCVNDQDPKRYTKCYETLETVGDGVLKSAICRYLKKRFPDEGPNFLSIMRMKMEKTAALCMFSKKMGLRKYIVMDTIEENKSVYGREKGRNTPKLLEDVFEAVVGAIVEDFDEAGLVYAERFVWNVIEEYIDFSDLILHDDNYKSTLQIYYQSVLKLKPPEYTLMPTSHVKMHSVSAHIVSRKGLLEVLGDTCFGRVNNYHTKTMNDNYYMDPVLHAELKRLKANDMYVAGIGRGKQKVQAEQECSRMCLTNFGRMTQ